MSAEPQAATDLLTSVSRELAHEPGDFVLRPNDHGGFGAVDPRCGQAVVLRPTPEGLRIERESARELVPWESVEGVTLRLLESGRFAVPGASVDLTGGGSLDVSAMHAIGADDLPDSLGAARGALLRVDRPRLLLAAIVAGAGLAAVGPARFARGERTLPVPVLAVKPPMLPGWAPPLLLLLSVVALLIWVDPMVAVAVTLVLLVHEYGHVAVMRLVDMKVRGVLLLPLLGAATVPEHAFATRWDEARVSLAGPITAVPVALAALGLWSVGLIPDGDGHELLAWIVGLNMLNLVPVMPLDGGRTLLCLAVGLSGVARRALAYFPIALTAGFLVLLDDVTAMFAGGVMLAFAFVVTRLALRRYDQHAWMEPFDLALLRSALRDTTFAFDGRAREDVDGGVPPCPLRATQVVAVIALYAGSWIALIALLTVAFSIVQEPL